MVDLVVIRDAGDLPGEDVVDPLISAVHVALARGRAELDRQGTEKATVRHQTVYQPGVRIGHLVEIQDGLTGEVFRAKVVGLQHEITGQHAVTQLSVERVVDF